MNLFKLAKFHGFIFLLGSSAVTGEVIAQNQWNQNSKSNLYAGSVHKLANNEQGIYRNVSENQVVLDPTKNTKASIHDESMLPEYDGIRISFYATNQSMAMEFEERLEISLMLKERMYYQRIYRGTLSDLENGHYVIDFIPVHHIVKYKRNELGILDQGNGI